MALYVTVAPIKGKQRTIRVGSNDEAFAIKLVEGQFPGGKIVSVAPAGESVSAVSKLIDARPIADAEKAKKDKPENG